MVDSDLHQCSPHINQYQTANQIVEKFSSENVLCVLGAEMQFGKTGIAIMTILSMFDKEKIDNCYLICGSSEKELKIQYEQDIEKYFKRINELVGNLKDERNMFLQNVENGIDTSCAREQKERKKEFKTRIQRFKKLASQLNNNVKVLFSDDLKKGRHDLNEDDIAANKLIIWDESHFAEAKKNRPAQWLSRNGLCKLVYNQACSFREGDGFLLTISATPFAQLYNLQKDNETSTADGDETQEEDENGSDDDFDQDDFDLKQNQFNTSSKFGTCVVVADKKAAPSYYGVADYIHRNQIHGIKLGDKAFRDLFETLILES